MPNHVVLASGAVVAVSVAVATAIAIYESPELRRYADDVRRRIAIALHSMGDGVNPPHHREPLFNRPEDADGFLQSRHGDASVEADEETRRRQRDELLYWNSVRLEKEERERQRAEAETENEKRQATTPGSSFDDFLRQDDSAEQGTFVFNTGADVHSGNDGLRNRVDGSRSFFTPMYTSNPFADEHHIDTQEMDELEASRYITPSKDEMSDIYSATTRDHEDVPVAREPSATLVDVHSPPSPPSPPQSSVTLERDLADDEYMTAGQDDHNEAYASIQAWAQNSSSANFYSPLPSTPGAPISEPEMISEGQLTPTDSVSVIEDIAYDDAQSSRAGDTGRYYDVMSESEGMMTPASWSEVGSVISENDAHFAIRQ